jgi:hypothetical protein
MTGSAQRLPVVLAIPEQRSSPLDRRCIAGVDRLLQSMRLDVVHNSGRYYSALSLAVHTQRVGTQVMAARLCPGTGVSTLMCGAAPVGLVLLLYLSMLGTEARSIYQSAATWLSTD